MASWSLDFVDEDQGLCAATQPDDDSQSSFPSTVVVPTPAKKQRTGEASPVSLTPEMSTGTLQRRFQVALASSPPSLPEAAAASTACSDPYMLDAVQPLSKKLDQAMMARQTAADETRQAEAGSSSEDAESAAPLVPAEEEHLTIGTPLVELDGQLQARLLAIYLLYMDVPCDEKDVSVYSQALGPLVAQEIHAYQNLCWATRRKIKGTRSYESTGVWLARLDTPPLLRPCTDFRLLTTVPVGGSLHPSTMPEPCLRADRTATTSCNNTLGKVLKRPSFRRPGTFFSYRGVEPQRRPTTGVQSQASNHRRPTTGVQPQSESSQRRGTTGVQPQDPQASNQRESNHRRQTRGSRATSHKSRTRGSQKAQESNQRESSHIRRPTTEGVEPQTTSVVEPQESSHRSRAT